MQGGALTKNAGQRLNEPLLVVLDLDETLMFSAPHHAMERPCDLSIAELGVWMRPGATRLLRALRQIGAECAVFTANDHAYAQPVCDRLAERSGVRFHAIALIDDCIIPGTSGLPLYEGGSSDVIKPLSIFEDDFDPGRIIAVDDRPAVYRRNPGQCIAVSPWSGSRADKELFALRDFLTQGLPDIDYVQELHPEHWTPTNNQARPQGGTYAP